MGKCYSKNENLENELISNVTAKKNVGKVDFVDQESERKFVNSPECLVEENQSQTSKPVKSCGICFDDYSLKRKEVFLNCQHSFCNICLFKALNMHPYCPVCRKYQPFKENFLRE